MESAAVDCSFGNGFGHISYPPKSMACIEPKGARTKSLVSKLAGRELGLHQRMGFSQSSREIAGCSECQFVLSEFLLTLSPPRTKRAIALLDAFEEELSFLPFGCFGVPLCL